MKKTVIILFSALLLFSAFGCSRPPDAGESTPPPSASAPADTAGTVADYYPMLENIHYVYQGEGNEYAGYDMVVDYRSDSRIQERRNNGGTELVRIVDLSGGKATVVYAREESYYRENALEKTDGRNEVLLMEPIKVGTSWTNTDGSVSTITGVADQIETPSGSYAAVVVERVFENTTATYYFAKGVGLVKIVSKTGDFEVTSTLAEIQKDVPFTQLVRFYYPNADDGKLYYSDQTLSFRTNDITATTFEAAYKASFEGRPGSVLSDNTKINTLYLSDDGMVYIDLSRDFITDMNAGSGYEAQLLQSLANTFGLYYGVDKVVPTIDGALYESGHIQLAKGEYLTVNIEGSIELK